MNGRPFRMPDALITRRPSRRFIAFACIGSVGFVVDASILTALITGLGWGLYSSRLVSFGAAVTVTWYLNRRWTFARQMSPDRKREYSAYVTVQTIGALVNLGVYSLFVTVSARLAAWPVIPLAIGSGVALVFNYLAAGKYVYTGDRDATGSARTTGSE